MARIKPQAGEVWLVDFGIAGKVRPVLVISMPSENSARSLVLVAPLTSQITGFDGEVDIGKPRWLSKRSAVNIQGMACFDQGKLARKLGVLQGNDRKRVREAILSWLQI